MIVPHLHFYGNCEQAIALYEKAFHTKADVVIRDDQHSLGGCQDDCRIAHASMNIHGQTIFLNDNETMFGVRDLSLNFPVHLIVYFQAVEELLDCYEVLKGSDWADDRFVKTPYSELVGNFRDRFGMLWGFMIAS